MKNSLKRVATGLLVTAALVVAGGVLAAAVPDMSASAINVSENPLQTGVKKTRPAGAPKKIVGESGVFTTIANILIFIVGVVSVIMLIIGGIRYAVSGGDDSNVKAAKNTILYAIVGLVVAFIAFAVVNFVVTQLKKNTTSYLPSVAYVVNQ